jgi:integrase
MKQYDFLSILKNEMTGFLRFRASQGNSGKSRYIIASLDQYLIERKTIEKTLSPHVIDDWISKWSRKMNPNTMRLHLSRYTQFAKYLHSLGVAAFIPDRPLPDRTYVPYIFTAKEMNDIFHAADNMKMNRPSLTLIQFPMLLRLLYGCGLRLGEALRLRKSDIDIVNDVLRIWNGKGNKDRLVPLEKRLSEVLSQYCGAILSEGSDDTFIFAGDNGGSRSFAWALQNFQRILRDAKIDMLNLPAQSRNICLHCLRHTFAVNSFRKQTLNGVDSYSTSPFLSIYLGHSNLIGTQAYLHMTAEISEDIHKIISNHSRGMFPEVPR